MVYPAMLPGVRNAMLIVAAWEQDPTVGIRFCKNARLVRFDLYTSRTLPYCQGTAMYPGMKEVPHLAEAFAQVLQEARGQARLSQAALARELGCARSFISFLETRDHLPGLNTFLAVAHALGMPGVELLARLETRLAALAARNEDMAMDAGRHGEKTCG